MTREIDVAALLEGTTPGPWLADVGQDDDPEDWWRGVEPGVCYDVARTADARLIAAAPALAAALSAERAANERLRALLTHANLCAIIRGHVYVTNATIEETASAILAAILASDRAALSPSTDDTADEWRCTVCGSDWGASFHTCWRCGQPAAPSTEGANDADAD